jgi:hypothetical protein
MNVPAPVPPSHSHWITLLVAIISATGGSVATHYFPDTEKSEQTRLIGGQTARIEELQKRNAELLISMEKDKQATKITELSASLEALRADLAATEESRKKTQSLLDEVRQQFDSLQTTSDYELEKLKANLEAKTHLTDGKVSFLWLVDERLAKLNYAGCVQLAANALSAAGATQLLQGDPSHSSGLGGVFGTVSTGPLFVSCWPGAGASLVLGVSSAIDEKPNAAAVGKLYSEMLSRL